MDYYDYGLWLWLLLCYYDYGYCYYCLEPDYGYGGGGYLKNVACLVRLCSLNCISLWAILNKEVSRRKSVFMGISNSDRRSQLRVCQTLLSEACGNIHRSPLLTAKDVSLPGIDGSPAAKRPLRRSQRKNACGKRRLF